MIYQFIFSRLKVVEMSLKNEDFHGFQTDVLL